jgi:hypothetical protein
LLLRLLKRRLWTTSLAVLRRRARVARVASSSLLRKLKTLMRRAVELRPRRRKRRRRKRERSSVRRKTYVQCKFHLYTRITS